MRNRALVASICQFALVGSLMLTVAGCNNEADGLPREAVSGTITLDGQPLADGVVQLVPASSHEGTIGGAVVKDGKFSIERNKGLAPGEYRVLINSSAGGEDAAGTPGEAPGPIKAADAPKDLVPARYNTKSTLKADVKPGAPNTFDFALKSK